MLRNFSSRGVPCPLRKCFSPKKSSGMRGHSPPSLRKLFLPKNKLRIRGALRRVEKLRNLVFEGLSPFKHCQKWQNITLHLIHYWTVLSLKQHPLRGSSRPGSRSLRGPLFKLSHTTWSIDISSGQWKVPRCKNVEESWNSVFNFYLFFMRNFDIVSFSIAVYCAIYLEYWVNCIIYPSSN